MIAVITSDGKIWNQLDVYTQIVEHMVFSWPIELDFLNEGPDIGSLGLYDFLNAKAQQFNYDLDRVSIHCANMLENNSLFRIEKTPPVHLLINAKDYLTGVDKKPTKHFGLFVGRSNAERLRLATYLDNYCSDKTLLTYHFNRNEEFHQSNIGLEDLINRDNYSDFDLAAQFLKKCPVFATDRLPTHIDKTLTINPAQQLLKQDKHEFLTLYKNFFVEIVCESYFTGQTFFPTEKTFRPILLKTPFIVQGPQYFLKNLKALGFQTFDQWWDEGYSEDPGNYQSIEIIKVLDFLSKKSMHELEQMYREMHSVVEHNYQLAMTLTAKDFEKLYEQR